MGTVREGREEGEIITPIHPDGRHNTTHAPVVANAGVKFPVVFPEMSAPPGPVVVDSTVLEGASAGQTLKFVGPDDRGGPALALGDV